MPIHSIYRDDGALLVTVMSGTLTDRDVLDYYGRVLIDPVAAGTYELVDGRDVVDLAITAEGLKAFAILLWERADRISHQRRSAMLAASDLVYDLFRLWTVEKGALPYPLAVFRDDEQAALRWARGEGNLE